MKNKIGVIIKEGKSLRTSSSSRMINDISPQITGNCKIDDYGIAIGYGNFKISSISPSDLILKCFSFMLIQLSSEPKIEFGLEFESKEINLISIDFATFLCSIRSEQTKSQVPFDGIDTSIRMFIENKKLFFYVNDIKIKQSIPIDAEHYSFFINVKNLPNSHIILATPFHKVMTQDQNDNFLCYFPKIINRFWVPSDKYIYSESFNHIGIARTDYKYSILSDELFQLPNSNLIYFEVIITSIESNSKFFIGITHHELTKSWSDLNVFNGLPYFSHPNKSLYYGKTQCCAISERIEQGTVIGFGIKKSRTPKKKSKEKKIDEKVFLIINGNEYPFNHDPCYEPGQCKKRFNEHSHFYGFLASISINFQCIFNMGQRPFKYNDLLMANYNIFLPTGWSIYSPFYPPDWVKGLPPDRHVLNMFCPMNYNKMSYSGISSTRKVSQNGRFEVTMLELENGIIEGVPTYKKGEETVAVGFSQLDYPIDQLIGWENGSYAIHSDDGSIFLNSGQGTRCDFGGKIRTGGSVMAKIEESKLSFYVNGTHIPTDTIISNDIFPSISCKASPCIIVNLGDSPFFNDMDEKPASEKVGKSQDLNNCGVPVDPVFARNIEKYNENKVKMEDLRAVDGIEYKVTLFNSLVVKMNTKDLAPFDLDVGDVIESRDRSFRGTIAGAMNGRIYCCIEKYDGAFPLVENKPIDVAITYRVLHRRNRKCEYPVLLYNSFVNINVSHGSIDNLYPTDNGLSFYIGRTTNRRQFVFRPLTDFYNNEPLFILNRMPESIINRTNYNRLIPLNINSDSQTRFFLSNENLMNKGEEENVSCLLISSQLNQNPKKNIKFLDIVKVAYEDKLTEIDKNDRNSNSEEEENALSRSVSLNSWNDVNSNSPNSNNIISNEENTWSKIRDIALIIGKKNNDIIAWNGDQLIIVRPKNIKIIQEPFYPFGSHRSFGTFRRISNGLFIGGIRYPPSFNGFVGSFFIQKYKQGTKYLNSNGGCKMPPFLYYFAFSLNEKKKEIVQFHHIQRIRFNDLPFGYYETNDNDENVINKGDLLTESSFCGGDLYSLK